VSHFEKLAKISSAYEKAAAPPSAAWKGSPFEWILSIPSRSKGAYGEKLVQELFRLNGFDVKRPKSGSDHDRVINGHRIEIKMSTLWAKNGHYKFQQIRDQEYDYLLCLGLSPNKAHCWLIPKSQVHTGLDGVSHQHGGKAGRDTLWLNFPANKPPAWMASFGGSLDSAIKLMKDLGGGDFPGKSISVKEQIL
jgi:hypothetical protein